MVKPIIRFSSLEPSRPNPDDTPRYHGRRDAIRGLHKAGWSVEDCCRLSRMSLPGVVKIIGLDKAVLDLYLRGRSFRWIAANAEIPLAQVAKLIGGVTRSVKHLDCRDEPADEEGDDLEQSQEGESGGGRLVC